MTEGLKKRRHPGWAGDVIETEKGRRFDKTNVASFYIDGEYMGQVRLKWGDLQEFIEALMSADYRRSLSKPEWEIFV